MQDEDFVAIANKSFDERLAWINGTEADGWTVCGTASERRRCVSLCAHSRTTAQVLGR